MKNMYSTYALCFALMLLLCVLAVMSWRLYSEKSAMQAALSEEVQTERAELLRYTEIVSRNGVDETVSSYVPPCSTADRRAFETGLQKLDTADRAEIEQLLSLYPTCGQFFALQKQALVQRLQDQVSGYLRLLEVMSEYNETAKIESAAWEKYLEAEQARADAFSSTVYIQSQLIRNQLTEDNATSDAALLERAQEAQTIQDEQGTRVRAYLLELQSYAVSE